MQRFERQRAPRHPFGACILAIFLEAEGVHGKHARVAGCGCRPLRQDLGDPVPQHQPMTETEVERMRERKCEDVARPVDGEGTVLLERQGRIALEPGPRRRRMATRGIVRVGTRRLDDAHARRQRGSRADVVSKHNECHAQAMGKHVLRIIG